MLQYYILCAVVGYLIGSIPFGYIIVKLVKGIDIRTVGSGNIGATNVGRTLGMPWGILCFLLDLLKGVIAIAISYVLFMSEYFPPWGYRCDGNEYCVIIAGQYSVLYSTISGLSAIIGHLFPIYLRFKGGKGVATALGVFLLLAFYPTLIAVVVWSIVFSIFGYVSLSSILASISLPIGCWFLMFQPYLQHNGIVDIFTPSWDPYVLPWTTPLLPIMIICILVPVLIIIRHIPNIRRLIAGTEPKISFKRSKDNKTLNP